MGLRKSIRNIYWRRIQASHAGKASSSHVFDWQWRKTPYNRVALVSMLAASRPNCRYLEIGCDTDAVFFSVPATMKVGVDPARGGTIRATSDDYFAAHNDRFDVIYIDGLHTYEQVRRDVVNALDRIAPDGWIVLHDTLPSNWIEGYSPRITPDSWQGDVWRIAFDLLATPGLEFRTVLIDNGCLTIRAPATVTPLALADKSTETGSGGFNYFFEQIELLPLVSWEAFRNWAGV